MLKKIVLAVALIALPALGAMAQQKFAHINSMAIISEMAEFKKAQTDLETMQKNYQDELQRTQEEFNKKYQEFVAQADSLPRNIAERRQKELQDMAQRQEQFQQDAYNSLQQAQQEAMTPIQEKVLKAVQEVGEAEGYIYVFDLYTTSIPFVGSQSVDITDKIKAKVGIK
ncbi:MAG: OmpH family outer membrane protein [Bacteroidaceae bacterium]|jgi:outer membrane protein|nr:OmpH family outer membrane protein [Bacteroidaceae bacterium]